jgi:hypothetical protein
MRKAPWIFPFFICVFAPTLSPVMKRTLGASVLFERINGAS